MANIRDLKQELKLLKEQGTEKQKILDLGVDFYSPSENMSFSSE